MHTETQVSAMDVAAHTANTWIDGVVREADSGDRDYAYAILRAWLHAVRDRLTVDRTARLAAELPDLIRGVFYGGWNPATVPVTSNAASFTVRFARDAGISVQDARVAARAVTTALFDVLPAGLLLDTLDQLPGDIRGAIWPACSTIRSTEGEP